MPASAPALWPRPAKFLVKNLPVSFKAWKVSKRKQTHAQPDFFTKSIILNTSEHRSTIKTLLVGTLQQELQVTSRQILGGLSQSLAMLRLNLLFVPGSPACIKRWYFLASRTRRFKSERRAISWCSKTWPAHESCAMSKMLVSCASPHRNNMLLLHIRANTFCDFISNSFEPKQRYASVRNSSNLLCAAAPLSSPENTIKIAHFGPVLPGMLSHLNSVKIGLEHMLL